VRDKYCYPFPDKKSSGLYSKKFCFILACKALALLIILIITSLTITHAQEYYGSKKKIILDNFYVNEKKAYPQSANLFTSKLKSALVNTNRFLIKKPKEVELLNEFTQLVIRGKILRCKEEVLTKWYDRALPVQFRGQKITKAWIEVEIDLCNPNTEGIVKSFRTKGNAKLKGEKLAGFGGGGAKFIISNWEQSALSISMNKAIKRTINIIIEEMDKYKWEAKITSLNGDKIYIDSGLECNIKAGTMLGVYDRNTKLNVGRAKIIEVNKNFSIAVITENHGIKPEMIVRMVE